MKRLLALLMCVTLAAPGCASSGAGRVATMPEQRPDSTVLADYVQKLPLGSPVRVELAGGRTVRGTLINATAQSLVVQARTRIPEPPIEVPLADVLRVTPDSNGGSNLAKIIGAGVAAGVGGALVVFAVLIALYSD